MGTLHRFRKAYGAIKDSTKVGLAKVNSDFKDLDIAIVKATNHVECPPKERYIRKIFAATSVSQPRADVAYCIHTLSRRLAKTHSWIVALKTLIVVHRALRDGDPTFREELLNFSDKGQVFHVSNFKDESSPLAWDCSAWVRAYALFLEERLECFRTLKYDIEGDRLTKCGPGGTNKIHSRARIFSRDELLEQLPILQQLMSRLTGCQPEGGAYHNYLVQYALALVLKESFKIYCAINEGIIKLVDMFFNMSKIDAIKAFNIYKKACQQAENLADFYDFCKGLDVARNFQFPTLRQPPPSFLATMEDYVKEAPQVGTSRRLEYHDVDEVQLEDPTPQETEQVAEEKEKDEEIEEKLVENPKEESKSMDEDEIPPLIVNTKETDDLLGLSEINPHAKELEDVNALALAIIQPGNETPSTHKSLDEIGKTSGWELALVTTPSSNASTNTQNKLGGGFDKLLLDSLYEDNGVRRQIQLHQAGYNSNYGSGYETTKDVNTHNTLYGQVDPFQTSSNIAPPNNVQMAVMEDHQHSIWHQQQQQQNQHNMMMMVPHQTLSSLYIHQQQQQQQQQQQYQQQQQQQQYQQHNMLSMIPNNVQAQYPQQHRQQQQTSFAQSSNPFGDPFSFPQSTTPQQGNRTLL